MKVYGVIMAGGGGTRFWPLSRQATPKQLLNLSGKELMVNEAIDRLSKTASNEDIFIVTNENQAVKMIKATKGRVNRNHIPVLDMRLWKSSKSMVTESWSSLPATLTFRMKPNSAGSFSCRKSCRRKRCFSYRWNYSDIRRDRLRLH